MNEFKAIFVFSCLTLLLCSRAYAGDCVEAMKDARTTITGNLSTDKKLELLRAAREKCAESSDIAYLLGLLFFPLALGGKELFSATLLFATLLGAGAGIKALIQRWQKPSPKIEPAPLDPEDLPPP